MEEATFDAVKAVLEERLKKSIEDLELFKKGTDTSGFYAGRIDAYQEVLDLLRESEGI